MNPCLTTLLLLLSTCYAQFNLKASTDNDKVGNKTICMAGGKATLLFPPDNSCVFTFKGGILTAYTNNGVLFNQGEQLTESDNFRGSQILFRNSVLDPPNDWQFTACPEEGSNPWSVWMDGSCQGGVAFEAVLTPLDDATMQALEDEELSTAEQLKSTIEDESAKSLGTSTTEDESAQSSDTSTTADSTSCDCDTGSSTLTISTKTVTEIVMVTGPVSSQVTEVTTTRTITQGRVSKVSSSAGVVTVTEHVTSFVVGEGQSDVPDGAKTGKPPQSETSENAQGETPAETQVETQAEVPANTQAAPTPDEQPTAPSSPAWNVGAPSGDVVGNPTPDANPTPDTNNNQAQPTIWWTQPSSPWWTQQTEPWWTPESVASDVSASSAVSGTVSASSSAQENGSKRVPTALLVEALLALFTVHIALL